MNAVFVSAGVYPFLDGEGMRIEGLALAHSQRERRGSAAVILPLYFAVSRGVRRRMRPVETWTVEYGWRRIEAALYRLRQDGVSYYFIGCDRYFDRATVAGHSDDGERFAFFAHAALEVIESHLSDTELLVVSGWGASQVIPCLKWGTRKWSIAPLCAVISEDNIRQGSFCAEVIPRILHLRSEAEEAVEGGMYSYLLSAHRAADLILCVTERQKKALCGIERGQSLWEKARLLPFLAGWEARLPFSPSCAREEKKRHKEAFCAQQGCKDGDLPLVAVAEDLTEWGAAVLSRALPDALTSGLRLVFCGMGRGADARRLLGACAFAGDRFLPLFSPDSDLRRRVLLAADAVLILSRGATEGEWEAMAHGAAVLSPGEAGERGDGFRYGYGAHDLSAVLHRFLEDHRKRGSLHKVARQSVTQAKRMLASGVDTGIDGGMLSKKEEYTYA